MSSRFDRNGNKKLKIKIKEDSRYKSWKRDIVVMYGECKKCGTRENLTAHHTIPISTLIKKYNLKTMEEARKCAELWDLSLGECLCDEHHHEIHDELPKERYLPSKGVGWELILDLGKSPNERR